MRFSAVKDTYIYFEYYVYFKHIREIVSRLIFSAEKSTVMQCFMCSFVSFGHLFPDQSIEQFLLNKTPELPLLANR